MAVLALLAVIGLYTAATMRGALFGTVLSGTRVFQQRAFVLADRGIERAVKDLEASTLAADYTRELHPADAPGSVTVSLRATGSEAMPVGFSAGRLVLRRYEIEAIGHAARGARSVQVQGVARVEPAP